MKVKNLRYNKEFIKELEKRSPKEQKRVKLRLEIFLKDPFDPRLRTHKLSGELKDFYSFSVDYHQRIIFEFKELGVVNLIMLGTHEIYRKN